VVDGPGHLANLAFEKGAQHGRGGKGSIFVWASGNGGSYGDSCACDGYANSIYTLSISSTSENGEKPWYLEECASTLATTFSSGSEKFGERGIATTDLRNKCTTRHTGTSAAAPMAVGIIALALEANPSLTWRDIMFLTILSSRPHAIKSNNKFITNKMGFNVSNRYGFGLMDSGRMSEMAKNWTSVPIMHSCVISKENINMYLFLKNSIR
jgi:subtilisin family serine protease